MTVFSTRLWQGSEATYDAILDHPFLAGLCDGTLPTASFTHFVVQDAHYLVDFARTLALLGSRAPNAAEVAMWSRHAAGAIEVERELHAGLLADLGIDAAAVETTPVLPTTRAYTSFLLATASAESYQRGVAAVLPCYWIYQRVGQELARKGSPDPRYQRWIEAYADESFDALVTEVLAVVDGWQAADENELQDAFGTAARFEWMFWDAAWRRETWPA